MRGMPILIDGGDPDTWVPPPCRLCGAEQHFDGQWLDVSRMGDSAPVVMPRRVWCSTPKCGRVCVICRRDIGDVHGPDCGPLMFTKLERPHIVDKSDCRRPQ